MVFLVSCGAQAFDPQFAERQEPAMAGVMSELETGLRVSELHGGTREVKPIMEIVELENMKAVGDAMEGTIGSSRCGGSVWPPEAMRAAVSAARFIASHVRSSTCA